SGDMWRRILKVPAVLLYVADNKQAPLRYAIRGGRVDAVRVLLECKEVSSTLDAGAAAVVAEAAQKGDLDILRCLSAAPAIRRVLAAGPIDALIRAADCGHVKIVQELVSAGAM